MQLIANLMLYSYRKLIMEMLYKTQLLLASLVQETKDKNNIQNNYHFGKSQKMIKCPNAKLGTL